MPIYDSIFFQLCQDGKRGFAITFLKNLSKGKKGLDIFITWCYNKLATRKTLSGRVMPEWRNWQTPGT